MTSPLILATCLVDSPLGGQMLLAVTERGLALLTLGDSGEALLADLRRRFPVAVLRPAGQDLAAWAHTINADLIQPRLTTPTDLIPLDLYGTPFQRRVWAALRQIPPGETRTYTAVAAAIDAPASVRAVAGACAANPVAILVPCHRVIRQDGGLGGYRWGMGRKRRLLDDERVAGSRCS